MTNCTIRTCFDLHFPETKELWKGQREKLVSYFRSLCYSLSLQKQKKILNQSFPFVSSPAIWITTEHCVYVLNLIDNIES